MRQQFHNWQTHKLIPTSHSAQKTLRHHQSLKHLKARTHKHIPPTELCRTIINRRVYTSIEILCNTHYVTHSRVQRHCMYVSECAHMFAGAVILLFPWRWREKKVRLITLIVRRRCATRILDRHPLNLSPTMGCAADLSKCTLGVYGRLAHTHAGNLRARENAAVSKMAINYGWVSHKQRAFKIKRRLMRLREPIPQQFPRT